MIDNLLHFRIIENKDWATILSVISFATIAITMALSPAKTKSIKTIANKADHQLADKNSMIQYFL